MTRRIQIKVLAIAGHLSHPQALTKRIISNGEDAEKEPTGDCMWRLAVRPIAKQPGSVQ